MEYNPHPCHQAMMIAADSYSASDYDHDFISEDDCNATSIPTFATHQPVEIGAYA
jgi:hypothetical protein